MKKKGSPLVKIGIICLLLAGIAWLGYSVYVVKKSGAEDLGIVTCLNDGSCIWTAHVHAYVPITICGSDLRLPTEIGPLTELHTHEEKNVIHWHDKLAYDNVKKQVIDTESLTLGAFFDIMKIPFDQGLLGDSKDGDLCPNGKPGILKMFVNGKENQEFRNYVWKNKDVISLIFDDRNISEIEEELKNNPITFPVLGRG